MNKPALFCGVVRNGGIGLRKTLDRLQLIRSKFVSSKFFIVTNDNTDATDLVLDEWRQGAPDTNIVIRVDGLLEAFPNRIDRICAARNFYLDAVRAEQRKANWSYCVVADLDGPNENLDENWFGSLEDLPISWDGLFANQIDCYYDIYALRHASWCPEDCWLEVERSIPRLIKRVPIVRSLVRRSMVRRYVFSRQQKIPETTSPIKVVSAFGGLGIYRVEALDSIYYRSRRANNDVVCEHVALNEAIVKRGGNLFIVPSLLNLAPKEHIGKNSGALFQGYKDA